MTFKNSDYSSPDTSITYRRRRGSKISNPVVTAMLNSNLMNDCTQVHDMFNQCTLSGGDSRICDTARTYFESCKTGNFTSD